MSPVHKNRKQSVVGAKYKGMYRGKEYSMEVVGIKGRIAYRVSGTDYSSPSAAAKSITGAEVNGWRFWRMD